VALDTVQDYVNEARTLLQDTVAPYRYADADMVVELNLAIFETKRIRPDFFFAYRTTPYPTFSAENMDAAVPFEDQYRPALTYYLVGKCTLRDEEDTDDKRGMGFVQKFAAQLVSLGG
jgi:hypothetical protein